MLKEIIFGLLLSATAYSQFREIEYVDSLKINNKNIKRYVCIKDEHSGILDLQKLANESYYEEAALYHDSTWTEVGHRETGWIVDIKYGLCTRVQIDSTIYAASDSLEDAVLYHIHHMLGHPNYNSDDSSKVNALKINMAIPSDKDIEHAIKFPKITHKIASPLGITTIGFNTIPEIANYKIISLLDLLCSYYIEKNTIKNDDDCIDNIRMIAESWSSNNSVWIKFTPYRSIEMLKE